MNFLKLYPRSMFIILVAVVFVVICTYGKISNIIAKFDKINYTISSKLYFKHEQPRAPSLNNTQRLVYDVNCDAIIKGDRKEISRAEKLMSADNFTRIIVSDSMYITLTKNCDQFTSSRYVPYYSSPEEDEMSVAYSILLYKEVEQAERLLRAIYSPRNYYCLHVDADANIDVHNAIDGIANCFPNVFVASRKEYVVYAGFTRLQADLTCMENLLQRGKDWKYFINLPSQQFPLKTNAEIAKILRIYNGSNNIQGDSKEIMERRFRHRYGYRHTSDETKPQLFETNQTKEDPPYHVKVFKGSAYGIFSREFVNFVINNRTARVLLDWFRDIYSPDEYYWATLNYNSHLGTPGSSATKKPDDKPFWAVYIDWKWAHPPCTGKFVRNVCIFGIGDLQRLVSKPHMFANKFYIDFQPYALSCMEEWHFNKSANVSKYLNLTYYEPVPLI